MILRERQGSWRLERLGVQGKSGLSSALLKIDSFHSRGCRPALSKNILEAKFIQPSWSRGRELKQTISELVLISVIQWLCDLGCVASTLCVK